MAGINLKRYYMKRVFLVVAVILTLTSCGYIFEEMLGENVGNYKYGCYWHIKNETKNPIVISSSHWSSDADGILVNPTDSAVLCFFESAPSLESYPCRPFELLYTKRADYYVDIFSSEGVLLKRWEENPDIDTVDRHLYNEAYWQFYDFGEDKYGHITYAWVFDLLPEDIEPAAAE